MAQNDPTQFQRTNSNSYACNGSLRPPVHWRQQESGPEIVSKEIQQALEASKPKARYLAGVPISSRLVLHLGDSVWDFVLRRMFKITPAARHSF